MSQRKIKRMSNILHSFDFEPDASSSATFMTALPETLRLDKSSKAWGTPSKPPYALKTVGLIFPLSIRGLSSPHIRFFSSGYLLRLSPYR